MKELKDYADEINKCSKCGLCQAVCPIYKETGNDCAVSRGKFVMLDGVIKGDLKLNKNINKYLEMCLKCDKCSKFCPSGIDVCEIFRTAKHEYLKKSFEGKVIRFLQSKAVFDKVINLCHRTFITRANCHSELLASEESHKTKKLLYFRGCAEKVFPPISILSKLGYNIEEADFECCGIPFLSSGNPERYEEARQYNTKIINRSSADIILTDCSSCEAALKQYPDLTKPVINTSDFIKDLDLKFVFPTKQTVTFHKPCHLADDSFLNVILSKCENVEYREMPNYDDCCGFAGQFALTNRKLSLTLSRKKAEAALSTKADIILTTCPACILGLKQGLIAKKGLWGKKPKVMYISEFLTKAEIKR